MIAPVLSRPLTLETPERTADGAGGYTHVWTARGVLWAEVTARSGRTTKKGGAAVSRQSYRIVVRARPIGAPDRPTPVQRFRQGSRVFRILSVHERSPDGRYLTCITTEEVSA